VQVGLSLPSAACLDRSMGSMGWGQVEHSVSVYTPNVTFRAFLSQLNRQMNRNYAELWRLRAEMTVRSNLEYKLGWP